MAQHSTVAQEKSKVIHRWRSVPLGDAAAHHEKKLV
jgi:hypothetical protein